MLEQLVLVVRYVKLVVLTTAAGLHHFRVAAMFRDMPHSVSVSSWLITLAVT